MHIQTIILGKYYKISRQTADCRPILSLQRFDIDVQKRNIFKKQTRREGPRGRLRISFSLFGDKLPIIARMRNVLEKRIYYIVIRLSNRINT